MKSTALAQRDVFAPAPFTTPAGTGPEGRPTIDQALQVLQQIWGYPSFRSGQHEAITAVLRGGDVLTVLPTGGGKSLIYQVPALLLPGTTVVVSPLISLMKDQIDRLNSHGVAATFVNSSISPREMESRLLRAEDGQLKLLYVSPERFDSGEFRMRLTKMQIPLLAIDEAHCVSEWGHDFRPAYTRLGRYRELLGNPQILALTATATPEVRRDVIQILNLQEPTLQIGGFDRANLHWHVLDTQTEDQKSTMLLSALQNLKGGSAIVYASTKKKVEQVAHLLQENQFAVGAYHSEIGEKKRREIQDAFMNDTIRIMVATNAFGMGVDKADVRRVIHWSMPGTMEAYYQEAGRAGRDGEKADCVLLYSPIDRTTHEFLIDQTFPPRGIVERVYQTLEQYVNPEGKLEATTKELQAFAGISNDAAVYASLRILAQAEIIHYTSAGREGVFFTLTAPDETIKETLAEPKRADDLLLLRSLYRLGGGKTRVRQGAYVPAASINDLPGGKKKVREALYRLEADGILEWKLEEVGTRVLKGGLDPRNLPLPWESLEERRRTEIAKLDRVQAYAETRKCRRNNILAYFGDTDATDPCGRCDRCRQDRTQR